MSEPRKLQVKEQATEGAAERHEANIDSDVHSTNEGPGHLAILEEDEAAAPVPPPPR